MSSRPDPGLFGPDSVTWQVHADGSMALGGLRALLLQALHPLAIAGVDQFSNFRDDPWGRLLRTAGYIGAVTYGTSAQAHSAGAKVRGVHSRLRPVDPRTGREFRIDEPDLLRWVHCCEVESFLSTYLRSGGTLGDGDADRYYFEQRSAAALVGLDPQTVPGSRAEMAAYFRQVRPELALTPAARRTAMFVLVPPMPAWVRLATPAQPAWLGLGMTAMGLLPRWARRLYGLPGLPTTDLGAVVAARAIRTTVKAVPTRYREGPHLVDARRRLGIA